MIATHLIPFSARRALAVTAALVTLAAPAGLHAQVSAAHASGKEYALAHTSSFDPPPVTARNPFWPIGWVPTAAAPTQAAALNVRAEDFVVTTISMDAPALAVINGKTRGVGDQIPVSADGREIVTVKAILDGVVVLDYHGHELRTRNDGGGPRKVPTK